MIPLDSNDQVGSYNHDQLTKLQESVACTNACHSSAAAKKMPADDMSGLQPMVFLAKGAKVMLTMNLWPGVGLCNGATGTTTDRCIKSIIINIIDIGKSEKTPGISYVAISRVKTLSSLVIEPMTFQRLTNIKSSATLQYRLAEEARLDHLAQSTCTASNQA